MSTSTRPSSAPPQPLSHPPHSAQTSQTHHPAAPSSNPNPFLSSTRPRIDQPATQSSVSAPISIADRARSMSTSSLLSAPVGDDAQNMEPSRGFGQGLGGGKAKDMFSWFSETVIISQIVRNWPS